jgi:hypothetical protein
MIPDFFIVGAPKCGTTALYEYLRGHPGIALPERKEPHYFCTDLNFPPGSAIRDDDEYLALFDDRPQYLHGDASASYLYSKVALGRILAANPQAKLIAILRNPVDAAYSMHSQLLANLTEDERDFRAAWALQEARCEGRRIPSSCVEPRYLQYRDVFSYAAQIERLLQDTAPEQALILIFEEMACDMRAAYERVLRFLDLPSDGRTEFARVNGSRTYRSQVLNRMIRRPPMLLRGIYGSARRAAHAVGLRPRRVLERINARPVVRAPLDPSFRAQLRAEFAPDVARLEGVLGRRLDAWRA